MAPSVPRLNFYRNLQRTFLDQITSFDFRISKEKKGKIAAHQNSSVLIITPYRVGKSGISSVPEIKSATKECKTYFACATANNSEIFFKIFLLSENSQILVFFPSAREFLAFRDYAPHKCFVLIF